MKLIEMSDYNRAAKTYWVVMVCAGAAVSVWALQRCVSLSPVQWAEFAGLLGLVILAGSNPIRIPNTKSSFTAGDAFTFLTVLFLGVPAAVLIGITDSFVSSRRTSKRSASWIGAPAMMAVTVFIMGNTFYLVLGQFAHVPQNPLRTAPIRLGHLLAALALMDYLRA